MTTLRDRIDRFAGCLAWGYAGGAGAVEHWFFPAPPDPNVMAKSRDFERDQKTATFGSCKKLAKSKDPPKPGHLDHGGSTGDWVIAWLLHWERLARDLQ